MIIEYTDAISLEGYFRNNNMFDRVKINAVNSYGLPIRIQISIIADFSSEATLQRYALQRYRFMRMRKKCATPFIWGCICTHCKPWIHACQNTLEIAKLNWRLACYYTIQRTRENPQVKKK